jgi:Tfp pilus assembly PilM family ATPase
LAKENDITSTDKLIKIIKGKPDEATPAPVAPPPEPGPPKAIPLKTFSPKKSVTPAKKFFNVGIDIGHEYLHLVRAAKTSGRKWEVAERRRLTIPAGISRRSPEFAAFLKSSLASFCESPQKVNLWAIMSAAKVEMRHIRIPKVPAKQIGNTVLWMVKKETPFNEKDTILDFEDQGEVIEQGIPKISVMVYTAPRQDMEEVKDLFAGIGWPLTGISIVPFAMQNLFRTGWIPTIDGSVASLFIGNDFSRIDIYNRGNLVMTRGIKAGASSLVEALVERLNEMKGDPRAPRITLEQGRSIVNSLSPDSPPLEDAVVGVDLSKEDVFDIMKPALERLIRQVERTFEHYATTGGSERISRLFISSAMSVYPPLVEYVGEQLDISRAVLDPLSMQDMVACPDVDDARSVSDRIAFTPALGIALSDDDYTPNLMYTFKDKEQAAGTSRINKAVFAVCLAIVLVLAGILAYQGFSIGQKKSEIARLEAQLASLGPAVDRSQIEALVARVKEQRQLSKKYAERYLSVVIVGEFAALTPANIRLIDMKMNMRPAVAQAVSTPTDTKGPPPATPAPKPGAQASSVEEVTVEGLVIGQRQTFESALAKYVLLLESSPLFRQVTIQSHTLDPYPKGEALRFILNMKVEEKVHG